MHISLNVNLTRFFSQHGRPSAIFRNESDLVERFRSQEGFADRVRTLDRNDNYIASFERLEEAKQANWPLEFAHLIVLISALLERQLQNGVEVVGPDHRAPLRAGDRPHIILEWSDWVVKQIEVYWEFYDRSALTTIEQFRWQLPRIASHIRAAHYEIPGPPEEPEAPADNQTLSALSLSIPLGVKKLRLAIYAKHANRLRFEIRCNGDVRKRLGDIGTLSRLGTEDVFALEPFMHAVTIKFAERMNISLRALEAVRAVNPPDAKTLVDFLVVLERACRPRASARGRIHSRQNDLSAQLMRELLIEMVTTGRVSPGGTASRMSVVRKLARQRVVDQMETDGVLVRRTAAKGNRDGVFDVAPAYRNLPTVLRQALSSMVPPEVSLPTESD